MPPKPRATVPPGRSPMPIQGAQRFLFCSCRCTGAESTAGLAISASGADMVMKEFVYAVWPGLSMSGRLSIDWVARNTRSPMTSIGSSFGV